MKGLVTIATLAFWLVLAGVHGQAAREAGQAPAPVSAQATGDDARAPAPAAAPAAAPAPAPAPAVAEPRHRLTDVAKHADANSCWMAIDGVVYDLTDYLSQHPADPDVMLRHCGREASEAFRTKDADRPHSSYAQRLLARYRIGVLAK